ncbi:MAG: C69 family dipeptidase [Bacteroidales bacterium]|nr:C69 family dipeptidase [Bacteroidales bacterium]
MRYIFSLISLGFLWTGLFSQEIPDACTSILVSKGASADGSVMITYACDAEFLSNMRYIPAEDHDPGEYIAARRRNGETVKIKQVPHTYAVVGNINEHQVAIGETTTSGRRELINPNGLLGYGQLMELMLQRARTAREGIKVIVDLVEEYGYRSSMEAFSIADPNEAWFMEIAGPGPGGKGAIWVALRVPDGYVSCHANLSRIGEIPFNDKENCLYSENVKSFAIEKGYYDPSSGEPFRFNLAYCPPTPGSLHSCASRVWSILHRCAPSLNLSTDYCRAVEGADPYPLWVKPDKKLSVRDVMSLTRDHYEGTELDMTQGIEAGPFHNPYRWRPLGWNVDGTEYMWERPVSTQQTAYSFISQSRSWLPDAIGGINWQGVDDAYSTCFVPFYCSVTELPEVYQTGDLQHFSWNSAWWVFNFVANYANLKYDYMIKDIQEVQQKLEGNALEAQPAIEQAALQLNKVNPDLAKDFLTTYCSSHAEKVIKEWIKLGEHLITKYNDGYVKDEHGRPRSVGYPEPWLRKVIQDRPEQHKLKKWK